MLKRSAPGVRTVAAAKLATGNPLRLSSYRRGTSVCVALLFATSPRVGFAQPNGDSESSPEILIAAQLTAEEWNVDTDSLGYLTYPMSASLKPGVPLEIVIEFILGPPEQPVLLEIMLENAEYTEESAICTVSGPAEASPDAGSEQDEETGGDEADTDEKAVKWTHRQVYREQVFEPERWAQAGAASRFAKDRGVFCFRVGLADEDDVHTHTEPFVLEKKS